MELPSPTTSRFLLLVVALLTSGAIVGNWVHNEVAGRTWVNEVLRCEREASAAVVAQPGKVAAIEQDALAQRCRAPSERARSLYVFVGAAVAGLAGLAVLLALPQVIERRHQFRPLDGAHPHARRVAELLSEAGISGGVRVVVGGLGMRDAFTYGRPGRYTIAMPMGLLVRPSAVFDAVARHEVAHLAHRDVVYATLAQAMWYALLPVLAVPIIVGPLTGSVGLLPDYLWRATLLLLVSQLIARALLRSREHDADLRAADHPGGVETMASVLDLIPTDDTRTHWRRRLLALHPTPAERAEVIRAPERTAALTGLDGFTAAFLAAVIVPTVNSALATPLAGIGRSDAAWLIAALVAGPLLGGSVGVGAWRAATVLRPAGRLPPLKPAAFGVAAGLVAGQVVALEQLAAGIAGGFNRPAVLLVAALSGLGTTTVVAGVAEIVADAAPAWRNRTRVWVAVLTVASMLFATALWLTQTLQNALDFGGWAVAGSFLVTLIATPLTLGTALTTAALIAWSVRRTQAGARTPGWLVNDETGRAWPVDGRGLRGAAMIGASIGLAGGVVLVANRVIAGPAIDDAGLITRFYATQWLIAATAPTATAVLVLLERRRGAGLAMFSGQVAVAATALSFLGLNTALGGDLNLAFVRDVAAVPIALGLVLSLLTAAIGPAIITTPHTTPRTRMTRTVAAAAAAAGAVVSVAVLLAQAPLTAFLPDLAGSPGDVPGPRPNGGATVPGPSAEESELLTQLGALAYAEQIAPLFAQEVAAIDRLVVEIDGTVLAGPQRAARIRTELLAPTRTLIEEALTFEPSSDAVGEVHAHGVLALQSMASAFELFADAYEFDDVDAHDMARSEMVRARHSWELWRTGLAALTDIEIDGD